MGCLGMQLAFTGRGRPGLGDMPVQALLEWAFRRECAQLELPGRPDDPPPSPHGFGMEYVLLQRMRLGGVRIDTSIGQSFPHEDAETVAAIVSKLADHAGGRRAAISVAEHARAGTTPDWFPGVVAKVEPADWVANRHGRKPATEIVGHYFAISRGRRVRRDIRMCPVIYSPHPDVIERGRAAYREWWAALDEIRIQLAASRMLREVAVTTAMPPRAPWEKQLSATASKKSLDGEILAL
jgi:hypothetical protein